MTKQIDLEIENAWETLLNGNIYIASKLGGACFLDYKGYNKMIDKLSILRKHKVIDGVEYHTIRRILKSYLRLYIDEQEEIRNSPRKYAQKFIGKRNVREFIFNRDKWRCLKCNSLKNLTIDHIIPVNKFGENKLSNLQTL